MKKLIALFCTCALVFVALVRPVAAVHYSCPAGATNNNDGTCTVFLVASDDDTIAATSTGQLAGSNSTNLEQDFTNRETLNEGSVQPLATTYSRSGEVYLGTGNAFGIMGTSFVYVAYVEWDISSIPSGKTISDLKFHYHGLGMNGDGLVTDIVKVTTRPSTIADPDLESFFNEIFLSTTAYVNPWTQDTGEVPNLEVDLGSTAISDLEDALSQDWFAIGLNVTSPGAGMNNLNAIYSELYADANPKPTLEVTYQAQAIPDLVDTGIGAMLPMLGGLVITTVATRKKKIITSIFLVRRSVICKISS